jgi:predicted nucleic acid-binding Zn ribbon protein
VLCSKCGRNLPQGSQSCPACGTAASADKSTALAIAPQPICVKCGTSLPEGSQFCLKCGQAVNPESQLAITESPSGAAKVEALPPEVLDVRAPPPTRTPARRRRSRLLWYLILLSLAAIWISLSNDPIAQPVRDEITGARTQTIIEAPVLVKPQSFSYFEFTVPPGAVNVRITGEFNTESRPDKKNDRKNDRKDDKTTDNNIETYVLTDSAFVVWRNGYATGARYESDRVAQGTIDAALPAGSGIYYLVFNNRFSQRTQKTVHATVLLHYQTWIPEWLQRFKERMWNWFGLN